MPMLRIVVVIPTRNGAKDLARLLKSLSGQKRKVDVCVVDSGSTDDTLEVAHRHHAQVHRIALSEFNHGGTRQWIVERHPDYDVFVFMTQDAYLENVHAVDRLVKPFADPDIGAVCGRQLPHLDANPLAQHARFFNYPAESRIKTINDAAELGIKTAFMSNSFAAYRREALMDVGGFPNYVILGEDMHVAARMLLKGWKVAYACDACCRHSHNYTSLEEFRRYFDTGVFHARESWIREAFGEAGNEGFRFMRSELRYLGRGRFYLWPLAVIRNCAKLLGYKSGRQERRLPVWVKQRLSMHRRYWLSPHA